MDKEDNIKKPKTKPKDGLKYSAINTNNENDSVARE
jgi:hypothetical protein